MNLLLLIIQVEQPDFPKELCCLIVHYGVILTSLLMC